MSDDTTSTETANLPATTEGTNTLPEPINTGVFHKWRKTKSWLKSKETLCQIALEEGELIPLQHLVSKGYGKRLLPIAANEDNIEQVKLLLEAGLHPDSKREAEDWCALHYAACRGLTKMAELLLDAGADINSRSRIGYTPVYLATSNNRPETVRLFLKHNADISIRDVDDLSPLDTAKRNGYDEIAQMLGHKPVVLASSGWAVEASEKIVTKTAIDKQSATVIRHIFDFHANAVMTHVTCGCQPPAMTSQSFSETDASFLAEAKRQLESSLSTAEQSKPKLL